MTFENKDPVEEVEEEEEEDPEDHMPEVMENCGESHHCIGLKEELARCTERVEGKPGTAETCEQELIDFLHCVDHCVSIGKLQTRSLKNWFKWGKQTCVRNAKGEEMFWEIRLSNRVRPSALSSDV
eukprot:Nk52_evm19s1992 gene=Nk52_evmTU19s1992